MLELRQYQKDAVSLVRDKIREGFRVILLALTGSAGKTSIAGFMIHEAEKKGTRVLFIAHRKELIKQAKARMEREFGIESGVIMAGFKEELHKLVQVASIQTLQRRDLPEAKLIIIDEAHRALAPEYMKVLTYYKSQGAVIVGLTGTPFSANKRVGLKDLFECFVANIKCSELLALGNVLPIKAYGAGSVSSKGMKTQGGDFRQDELMKAFDVDNVYLNLIKNYDKYAKGKKTIIFCSGVQHSIRVTEVLLNHGVKAMHIDGNTPSKERDLAVDYFRADKVDVLVNCSIACEGLDVPTCEVEILCVATKSKIKYLQMTWRITRPCTYPDGRIKTHGILIDMADNYERFADMGILPDGDIEVSLEPEVTEAAFGVAPVKLCPCCSFMNNASAKHCNDCNEEFKKSKKEIAEEEFIELQKENKERRWKKYTQKDWYKVKDDELEAFAKVKGYKAFWITQEKERRKSEKKVVKIKDSPWVGKQYYVECERLQKTYYDKKPIDASLFVFEKEDKMYLIFRYVKKEEGGSDGIS